MQANIDAEINNLCKATFCSNSWKATADWRNSRHL